MHPFPHEYRVTAAGVLDGDVELTAARVPRLRSASPAEFDGPGDRWSPETFLVGAVADCFILTFRAVARAAHLPWTSLQCEATGTLDRIDRVTSITEVGLQAHLTVPAGTDVDRARRALEKAEQGCLISNSLKAAIRLESTVDVERVAEPAGAAS
jgi:organic hydroperoxide reductase OsmC/OhrA